MILAILGCDANDYCTCKWTSFFLPLPGFPGKPSWELTRNLPSPTPPKGIPEAGWEKGGFPEEEAERVKGVQRSWENPAAGTHLAVIGSPRVCARSWEGKLGPSLTLGWDGRAAPLPRNSGSREDIPGAASWLSSLSPNPSLFAHTDERTHTHNLSLSLPSFCSRP